MRRNAGFILWVLTMMAAGGWVGWMMLDNELPYDYDIPASYVTPNPVQNGHMMTIHWILKEVRRLCEGSTVRSFYDEDRPNPDGTCRLITTYDATSSALGVRKNDAVLVRTFMLNLPAYDDGTKPTNVIYDSQTGFRCNPVQHLFPIKSPHLTVRFRVQN